MTSIAEALAEGPAAARLALAHRLAALIDDEAAPAYTVVQAARALGGLLAAMTAEAVADDDDERDATARRILNGVA